MPLWDTKLMRHVNEIQGHPIIGSFLFPQTGATRGGRVILVRKSYEYVTGILFENDPEWWQGHYYRRFSDALEDFYNRCREWGWP